MNGNKASLQALLGAVRAVEADAVDIVIAPPTLYLETAQQSVAGSKVLIAAQNCHYKPSGAFTGETSVEMLKDIGVKWVIIGHSERRHVFHETDQLLADKVKAVQEAGLGAIVCVGETLDDREANKTNSVVLGQLDAMAASITSWSSVVVAYEPVWAIGTGKTATPDMAQAVHKEIRAHLQKRIGGQANSVRIIYGGSVNPTNCDALSAEADIDGFLVGGASLKADQFSAIIQSKVKRANL